MEIIMHCWKLDNNNRGASHKHCKHFWSLKGVLKLEPELVEMIQRTQMTTTVNKTTQPRRKRCVRVNKPRQVHDSAAEADVDVADRWPPLPPPPPPPLIVTWSSSSSLLVRATAISVPSRPGIARATVSVRPRRHLQHNNIIIQYSVAKHKVVSLRTWDGNYPNKWWDRRFRPLHCYFK